MERRIVFFTKQIYESRTVYWRNIVHALKWLRIINTDFNEGMNCFAQTLLSCTIARYVKNKTR